MTTECHRSYLDGPKVGSRRALADFDGAISSDRGILRLRRTEALTGIRGQFADHVADHRAADLTEDTVEALIAWRVCAWELGYEHLNDHDDPRHDPLLATVVSNADSTGKTRQPPGDQGKVPAGKSTLNRRELSPVGADGVSRSKKITALTTPNASS